MLKKLGILGLLLSVSLSFAAPPAVWVRHTDMGLDQAYKRVYDALEAKKFWVVFEADLAARMARFEELSSAEYQTRSETKSLYIPPGPRLGELVIEADGISKKYDDKLLYEDLSFKLPRGGIVGIIGANGAGKTTLFRMLTGSEQPDSGSIRIGDTVDIDTASCDVGCHENAEFATAEAFECSGARALRLVVVNGGRGNVGLVQMLYDAVGAVLRATED